jgi:hypothetical protein
MRNRVSICTLNIGLICPFTQVARGQQSDPVQPPPSGMIAERSESSVPLCEKLVTDYRLKQRRPQTWSSQCKPRHNPGAARESRIGTEVDFITPSGDDMQPRLRVTSRGKILPDESS